MSKAWSIMAALVAVLALTAASPAAELPTQKGADKTKSGAAAPLEKCNIGGIAGVLAPNGVCVRISGYISSSFNFRNVK